MIVLARNRLYFRVSDDEKHEEASSRLIYAGAYAWEDTARNHKG